MVIQVWAKTSKQKKKTHKYSKPALDDLIVQMVKSLITQETCEQNKCQPKNSKKHKSSSGNYNSFLKAECDKSNENLQNKRY